MLFTWLWQIFGFLFAGSIAAIVDIGLLFALLEYANVNPYAGRLISFICAVIVSWILNCYISFKDHRNHNKYQEFIIFFAVMLFGGSINWIIYIVLIESIIFFAHYPFLAIIPATAISLLCNFSAMKYIIFTK